MRFGINFVCLLDGWILLHFCVCIIQKNNINIFCTLFMLQYYNGTSTIHFIFYLLDKFTQTFSMIINIRQVFYLLFIKKLLDFTWKVVVCRDSTFDSFLFSIIMYEKTGGNVWKIVLFLLYIKCIVNFINF